MQPLRRRPYDVAGGELSSRSRAIGPRARSPRQRTRQRGGSDDQGARRDHDVGRRLRRGAGRRPGQGTRRGRRAAALLGVRRPVDATTTEPARRGRPARTRRGWRRRWRGSAPSSAGGRRTRRPATGATRIRGGCRCSSSRTGRRRSRRAAAFTFVSGVEEAIARAMDAAGGKDVHVMGGADVIRQALAAGLVDELTIIVAPVVLGGGQAALRGVHGVARPRAPRRAPVAVRDVHRLRSAADDD